MITKKPNRPLDQDTYSARSYANRPRVVVPRPSLANDDFRPKPRRYRNDRDLRGFTLRGGSDEAPCKLHLGVSRQGGIWSDPQHCQPALYR